MTMKWFRSVEVENQDHSWNLKVMPKEGSAKWEERLRSLKILSVDFIEPGKKYTISPLIFLVP